MASEENIRLIEELIAAINAHDVERMRAVLADDVVITNVARPEPTRGKEAAGRDTQSSFTAFPDYKVVTNNYVTDNEQVAVELNFGGTHTGPLQMAPGVPPLPATNKHVWVNGAFFARISDGKIVEIHQYPDIAGLLMQLGLMPAPGQAPA